MAAMFALRAALLAIALGAACGGNEQPPPPPTGPGDEPSAAQPSETAPAPEPASPETCADRIASLEARIEAIANEHSACRDDSECAAAGVVADCYSACGVAIHPSGVPAIDALTAEMTSRGCSEWEAAGCPPHRVRCERWHPGCIDGRCSTQGSPP